MDRRGVFLFVFSFKFHCCYFIDAAMAHCSGQFMQANIPKRFCFSFFCFVNLNSIKQIPKFHHSPKRAIGVCLCVRLFFCCSANSKLHEIKHFDTAQKKKNKKRFHRFFITVESAFESTFAGEIKQADFLRIFHFKFFDFVPFLFRRRQSWADCHWFFLLIFLMFSSLSSKRKSERFDVKWIFVVSRAFSNHRTMSEQTRARTLRWKYFSITSCFVFCFDRIRFYCDIKKSSVKTNIAESKNRKIHVSLLKCFGTSQHTLQFHIWDFEMNQNDEKRTWTNKMEKRFLISTDFFFSTFCWMFDDMWCTISRILLFSRRLQFLSQI